MGAIAPWMASITVASTQTVARGSLVEVSGWTRKVVRVEARVAAMEFRAVVKKARTEVTVIQEVIQDMAGMAAAERRNASGDREHCCDSPLAHHHIWMSINIPKVPNTKISMQGSLVRSLNVSPKADNPRTCCHKYVLEKCQGSRIVLSPLRTMLQVGAVPPKQRTRYRGGDRQCPWRDARQARTRSWGK